MSCKGKASPKWAAAPQKRGKGGGWFGEPQLPLKWLPLSPGESRLLSEEGLAETVGPALFHDKQQTVFSSATWIIGQLVPEGAKYLHDADWEEYPEVAAALKASGAQDDCYCIGVDTTTGRWAVGVASGWKNRETAAKLALAVAIVKDDDGQQQKLCAMFPEFRSVCAAAGYSGAGGGKKGGKNWGAMVKPEPDFMGHGAPQVQESWQQAEANDAGQATVTEISVATGQLAEAGFATQAPAIQHVKGQAPFSESHHVLQELVGDIGEEVQFEHDTEWTIFPEVAEALREAGLEECCFCIAKCASKQKWAVGMANGWKGRELAGKLALAVAIADDEDVARLAGDYPGFAALRGVAPSGGRAPPPAAKRPRTAAYAAPRPMPGATAESAPLSMKMAKGGKKANGKGSDKGEKAKSKRKPCDNPMPRDAPLWLQLSPEEAPPDVLGELPGGAVAVATENMERSSLYKIIDKVLERLMQGEKVTYHDDPTWKHFSLVGDALKSHSDEEAPMMLAVVPGKAWGVGFGFSGKARQAAAKAALGASLMLRQAEEGDIPELAEFGDFEEFVGEVTVS